MPHAHRAGLRLYYEQAGDGDPSMVFVHGWCCDRTFFQPQFDSFKASRAVTTLDLRGCGQSDQPTDGYDIPTLADDVGWLCREVGIRKPVVVGHSLGGMIAIELAARHPALPAAIVSVDPGPISPTPQELTFYDELAAQLVGPDGEGVRRAFIQGSFLPTDDADRRRRIVETMCVPPQHVAAAMVRGVVTWNGASALQRCAVPLLVILSRTGGSNDPARLLGIKPDVQIGVTVGTGHFHQLEAPDQVTPMIDRFLRVAVTASPT